MKEEFGVVLTAVTNGFKSKMNEVKQSSTNTINKVKQNIEDIKNEFNTGFNIGGIENAEKDIDRLSEELEKAKRTLSKAEFKSGINSNEYKEAANNVALLKSQLKGAKQDAESLKNSDMAQFGAKIKQVLDIIKGNAKKTFDNIKQFANETFTKSNIASDAQALANKVGNVFKNLKNKLSGVSKTTDGLSNSISKMADKAKNSLKKMVLAVIGIRSAFLGLKKAVSSYLAYDQQLSKQLQSAWAGLGAQLAPIIEFIVNLFAKAVSYINKFITALTGINAVARANTKALNGQAKASNKSLSAMDEITNIPKDSGGGGTDAISLPSTNMSDFMNDLLAQVKEGDWYGVGKTIAEKINTTLESINWDEIKEKARQIGTNIALFLNGGIENTNWFLVGSTLAEGLNTAIDFLYSFITTFNWVALGKAIADSINGFFSTVDWAKAGKTLSDGIIGILNSFSTWLAEVNWQQIGESIGEFLKNIDWLGIFQQLIEVIKGIIGGIDGFLNGIFGEKAATVIESIAAAVGILSAAIAIYNAVTTIAGAVTAILASPITLVVLAIAALVAIIIVCIKHWDDIKAAAGKAWDWIKDKWNKAAEWFGNIGNKIKNVFSKIWDGIKNGARTAINGIIGFMNLWIKGLNVMLLPVRGLIVAISKAFGKNVSLGDIKIPSIPKLATGTNYVPEDQMAYIHKGEAVVPKKFNSAEYFSNINNNEETNALLLEVNRTLIDIKEKDTTLNINGKELARTTYNDFKQEGNRLGQSSIVSVR